MFKSNKYLLESLQSLTRVEEFLAKVYLKRPETNPIIESAKGQRLSYAVCSMQGWRRYQEDSHISLLDFDGHNSSLFAVFDGHNGPEVALYATEMLPQLIKQNDNYRLGNIELALEEVFLRFDGLLLNKSVNNRLHELREKIVGKTFGRNHMLSLSTGCTALVVLIKDDTIYVANIGDSRCVLSKNGKPIVMTTDHNPEDKRERKRVEKSGGLVVDGRINGGLNLSRAFGDHQYKRVEYLSSDKQMVIARPEIRVRRLKPGKDDFLVMACDGIWNSLSNQKVINFISRKINSEKLATICHQLIHKCLSPVFPLDGTGGDNMTCIIVKFESTRYSIQSSESFSSSDC